MAYTGARKGLLFSGIRSMKGQGFYLLNYMEGGSISSIVVDTNSEKSGFRMIAMIAAIAELFFSAIAAIRAIVAIVAIIWKSGFKLPVSLRQVADIMYQPVNNKTAHAPAETPVNLSFFERFWSNSLECWRFRWSNTPPASA